MTINGLPLHPLVVHGAVVAAPLAGLIAIAYAIPRLRDRLRPWVLVLGVLSALLVWFAAFTGGNLESTMNLVPGTPGAEAVHHHEDLAGKLQVSTWVLGALALLGWWLHERPGAARTAISVLLPIGGIAVIVLCVMTGDAGARAVWVN